MHKYFNHIYLSACAINLENICTALSLSSLHKSLLDVGCWDGVHTLNFAKAIHAKKIFGIEPVASAAKQAADKGITVLQMPADKRKWPLPDNSIDCIVSNQVIEHLNDLDQFFSESFRVLSPEGIIITSTNNLSSLHNIFSIFMGWAPFDLANSSYRFSTLGNPLGLHISDPACSEPSWTHKCVYTAYWLNEWQKKYGFTPIKTFGAGLYPFPSSWGRMFPQYSAFITTACQKPK